MSVYVHCKTHRKRSGIEMNETLNLHRQRTKWTADIELDKKVYGGWWVVESDFSVSFCQFSKKRSKIKMDKELDNSIF